MNTQTINLGNITGQGGILTLGGNTNNNQGNGIITLNGNAQQGFTIGGAGGQQGMITLQGGVGGGQQGNVITLGGGSGVPTQLQNANRQTVNIVNQAQATVSVQIPMSTANGQTGELNKGIQTGELNNSWFILMMTLNCIRQKTAAFHNLLKARPVRVNPYLP